MAEQKSSTLGSLFVFSQFLFIRTLFYFCSRARDFGILRRAEINHDIQKLQAELTSLNVEIADLKNLTRRLSDHYLDLELLDQQARDILGYVRSDELVIQ